MLNQYAWWKYLIIGLVLLTGIFYAIPNLFGSDPAVQISSSRSGVSVDQSLLRNVLSELDGANVSYRSGVLDQQHLLVRFADEETQLKAADILKGKLGRDYVVALNLAPSTPDFMRALGLAPMNLGLDLRGGVHFLMEVDMPAAIRQAQESYLETLRVLLRQEKVRYTGLSVIDPGEGMRVSFRSEAERDKALEVIRDELPNLQTVVSETGFDLILTMSAEEIQEKKLFALEQNRVTLGNRVNELGVAEPLIQRQGDSRIIVQLPGVQDTARAKEIIGATATLEFRMVDQDNDPFLAKSSGRVPLKSKLFTQRENGAPILLHKEIMLTGEYITDASSGLDQQNGSPAVFITLDGKGARRFENATKENIGKPMAVVFIETKTEFKRIGDELQRIPYTIEEVINVATIRERLSRRFMITGLDSTSEARDLALLLRAGALAAPITIVEERTVGPSAGQDNIDQGFRSALIAFLLVLIFMALYYRMFGLISDLALIVNVVLIIAILSMVQATLTLPGIAGIILTMGMAVDANVLIFERIREELKLGNTPQAAINRGFNRAFATILDANVTTLIAAVILGGISSGPVRGFAVTLGIGILTSMFTAVMGARGVVNFVYGGRHRLQTLPI